ncbi:MAG: chemotaxis protein CheW [Gallionella sp.]
MQTTHEQTTTAHSRELLSFSLGKNVANRVVGMVVDGVSDVLTLKPEQIKRAPESGSGLDARYLQGLGTVEERMIILADIEELLGSRDMELVDMEELAA